MSKSEKAKLVQRRDDLIRELWKVYRDMSDIVDPEDFDEADLNLWSLVTNHTAVQSKLGN